MKIFIVSSYFGDSKQEIEKNIEKARAVGIEVFRKNHLPFVPQQHFAFWEDYLNKKEIINLCFDWIKECDAILVINEAKKGSGTEMAIQVAKNAGKNVFYSIEEIPTV